MRRVLVWITGGGLVATLAAIITVWPLAPAHSHPDKVVLGWLLVQFVVLFAGLVFERIHYKAIETGTPGKGWQASGERFIDPETGTPVAVWYHAETGERRYVARPPG